MQPHEAIPVAETLEFVALDLLGPVPTSAKGFHCILVMSCLYINPTRAIPLLSVTATCVAQAFVNNCVFVYWPVTRLLSDNGTQFTATFFQAVCRAMRVPNLLKTAYRP